MGKGEIPGQMSFEDIGEDPEQTETKLSEKPIGDFSVAEATEETPQQVEEKVEAPSRNQSILYGVAKKDIFKNPFSKNEEDTTLLEILEATLSGTTFHDLYVADRDRIYDITHLILNKFPRAAEIRALAGSFRKEYLEELDQQIDEINERLENLQEHRYDLSAASEAQRLIQTREQIESSRSSRTLTGNEISLYLNLIADELEKREKDK